MPRGFGGGADGRGRLVIDGNIYCKVTERMGRIYWRCKLSRSRNCPSRAVTKGGELLKCTPHDHNTSKADVTSGAPNRQRISNISDNKSLYEGEEEKSKGKVCDDRIRYFANMVKEKTDALRNNFNKDQNDMAGYLNQYNQVKNPSNNENNNKKGSIGGKSNYSIADSKVMMSKNGNFLGNSKNISSNEVVRKQKVYPIPYKEGLESRFEHYKQCTLVEKPCQHYKRNKGSDNEETSMSEESIKSESVNGFDISEDERDTEDIDDDEYGENIIMSPLSQAVDEVRSQIPSSETHEELKVRYDLEDWRDPNVLVDRIRILMSSPIYSAGVHNKEIKCIIRELRLARYIY